MGIGNTFVYGGHTLNLQKPVGYVRNQDEARNRQRAVELGVQRVVVEGRDIVFGQR